jgi:hypothetical protein
MKLGKSIKTFGFYFIMGAFIVGSISIPTLSEAAPQASQSKKRFVVDYADYNKVLRGLILIKRGNSRKPKLRATPPTGTRISFVNRKLTRYESNRVMFHMLKDGHKDYIRTVRQSLESIPGEFPLNNFGKDEQLAYWLNLRNIMALEAVMDIYPVMKLKRPWKKISNDKSLTVAGTKMSINDIEALIIKQWPNPQVIYGFYNGTVGGPNIRKRAYTGRFVWDDLNKNAKEFVNSIRGVQFFRKTAKIAEYYEGYPSLFPNFKEDVQKHLISILRPSLGEQLKNSKKIKFNINDWSIADLMNGRLGLSSPGSIGPAALVNSVVSTTGADGTKASGAMKTALARTATNSYAKFTGYPAHVQVYLRGMQKRMLESVGKVTIEEVDSKTTEIKVKEEEKEQKKKKNN